jgi:metal-responsive CopG/Arc/MetJ family transcriptional regulator
MTERKTPRVKSEGFVGLQLTPDLLKKLDARVKETTLNRSQVIRMALIEYLK